METKELETKAAPIIEGLEKGFFVDNYPDEHLRLALAYKMWADGQDPNLLDEIIKGDEFWTLDNVKHYLVNVFNYKCLPISFPGIGG